MPVDALIVGAGPAGSALACRLARRGVRVRVLDRAVFPREKPCSEYLSPGTVRALEQLGVLDEILAAQPARVQGMRVFGPDGVMMEGVYGRASPPVPLSANAERGDAWVAPYPWALALPRRTLDLLLRNAAAAAGAEIIENASVVDVVREDGAVVGVVTRGGRAHRARVVVGADGLRSVVARRTGRVTHVGPQRVALTAHVLGVDGVNDWGELHVGDEGYVGLGPLGNGATTIALVLPLAAVRRLAPNARDHFFPALERFPALAGRVPADGVTRNVLVTGPFARWARRPVTDGALLVGDAADFFDPFTGQGIFAALKGAELAAGALATALERGGPVRARALASYVAGRRAAFRDKWLIERAIGLGVGWPALARRVIGRLARRPALADLVVGAAGNYAPARAILGPRPLLGMLW
jgi:flavin-dependent dehydrogenase